MSSSKLSEKPLRPTVAKIPPAKQPQMPAAGTDSLVQRDDDVDKTMAEMTREWAGSLEKDAEAPSDAVQEVDRLTYEDLSARAKKLPGRKDSDPNRDRFVAVALKGRVTVKEPGQ